MIINVFEVIGSIYSVRYSLTTTLIKSGVNPMEVSKNWTKHTTVAVNKYYQQEIAKESEQEQQDKFEQYVMNKNNGNDSNKLNGNDAYGRGQGANKSVSVSSNASYGRFGPSHPSSQAAGSDTFDKNAFMKQVLNLNPSHLHIHFS